MRDPARKLAWNDRLVGAMRLALEAGQLATGARLATALLSREELQNLWPAEAWESGDAAPVASLI